jgi:hypothetical protein
MRTILLCGGILLVVLFFLGVFKMKEGFYLTVPCSTRTNKTGCEGGSGCSWSGSSNDSGICKLTTPCSSLTQPVCTANYDVCKWIVGHPSATPPAHCSSIS